MELEQNAGQFQKLGLNVAGISYDTVEVLHNFAERKDNQKTRRALFSFFVGVIEAAVTYRPGLTFGALG